MVYFPSFHKKQRGHLQQEQHSENLLTVGKRMNSIMKN
jgi:hypothetical protein